MHKAKENANSTFSIGKTWVLDDLTAIESFTNAIPQTAEEQQNKQRAGPTGFIVTVQKPYYWNAHTAKEKDFFIFSLIKIFKKYTGGKLPTLLGFTSAELEQLGGITGTQNASQSDSQPGFNAEPNGRRPSHETTPTREPRSQNIPPETTRERRSRPPHERTPQERPPQQIPSQEWPMQERQLHSAVPHPVRNMKSNERLHLPGSFPSTDSVNDPNQQPQFRAQRSDSPALSQQPNFRRPGPNQSTESFRTGQEFYESARSSNERPRQNGSYSSSSLAVSAAEERSTTSARDTRGPSPLSQDNSLHEPIPVPALNFNPQADERQVNQETPRPGKRGGHFRDHSASSRSSNRGARGSPSLHQSESSDHLPEERRPSAASSHEAQARRAPPSEVTVPTVPLNHDRTTTPQPSTATYPPTPPPDTPTEEAHRPGLGPMIKSKKSTTNVANKFRKAATAYNAFKPRGAADELQENNTTSGDGITGVFQAPSLVRAATQDESRPSTPRDDMEARPSTPENQNETPSATMTISPLKQVEIVPTSVSASIPADPQVQKPQEPLKVPPIPEKAYEERRKRRQSDHSAKYAKVLGINPNLLEGRTLEIETMLDDFGWGEEKNQRNAFEELENGIRKELARVEAGSWLGAVESNDDRTTVVGDMMDRVIAECEELDCLLTLYNVELGVRKKSSPR